VDDCADALVHLMATYSGHDHVNVGAGDDLTILELTQLVCEVVGFKGEIVCDTTKPDGTPRKLMDSSRLRATGWAPRIGFREGLADTYRWFLETGGGEGRPRLG
jgi:GDP-L-fucose synthase